jgi:hypothetical protein
MTEEEAVKLAREWLLAHGYTQWPDGFWQSQGYEVEVDSVLAKYIKEKE